MLIVANWKAYVEDAKRARELFATAKRLSKKTKHEIVLAPAMPHLGLLAAGNKSKVAFAAQDVSATTGGAKTGEVPAETLANLGVAYTLIGHSERRAMGETDAMIAEKARHALAHDLIPILCVGERERDAEAKYLSEVRKQISSVFEVLSQKERMAVIVAYEPVWAIGKSAADALPSHELAEMILYIRKVIGDYLPGKAPSRTRIVYGGSIEPDNARELAGGSGIDGFLIGHASVDPVMFPGIIKALS
jgi:triosephosphate isomerase (TIM)